MKSLTSFIEESLILELSSDTYKKAFDKAKARGDKRAEKFLDAYANALKSEIPDTDELKDVIDKWYKEDKIKYPKIHKLGINVQKENKNMYSDLDEKERIVLNTCTSSEGLTYIPRLKSVKDHGYTKGWSTFIKKYFNINPNDTDENEENYLLEFNTYSEKTHTEYCVKYFNGKSLVSKYDENKDEMTRNLSINDLPEEIKDPIVKAIKLIDPEATI